MATKLTLIMDKKIIEAAKEYVNILVKSDTGSGF